MQTPVDDLEIRLEFNATAQIDTLDDRVIRQSHILDIGGNVRFFVNGVCGFVHFDGWENLALHVDEAILFPHGIINRPLLFR